MSEHRAWSGRSITMSLTRFGDGTRDLSWRVVTQEYFLRFGTSMPFFFMSRKNLLTPIETPSAAIAGRIANRTFLQPAMGFTIRSRLASRRMKSSLFSRHLRAVRFL